MTVLALFALALAAVPALLYLRNRNLFRPPPTADGTASIPRVSVLIPARNEEGSIAACVESVLASRDVELEVVVLDDHSEDRTAEVVLCIANRDSRVRLKPAPPLPPGWCGKQHACFTLSKLAAHPVLTFLDADVRLTPDGVARMAAFLDRSGAALVSGFPRQETGTLLEKLVIPLIHWLLVCYLPMGRMRADRAPRFGAGCGQWFMTTRGAYEAVGGHAAVKASLHDGVKLPRAYRTAGLGTDICDASTIATCRMYRSAGGVWNGLAKNAREGLGAPGLVWVWTVLLLGGQVLPFILMPVAIGAWVIADRMTYYTNNPWLARWAIANGLAAATACVLAWQPRFAAASRFRASWVGALLHPVGVSVLLAIQWYATLCAWVGRPVGWKGRSHPARA